MSSALLPTPVLSYRQVADDLEPWVSGFVHRDDLQGGTVVLELPELRPSLQVMLGDPYWLRDQEVRSSWRRAPDLALWGPRYELGYGFAAHRIKVYAVVLTALGAEALAGKTVGRLANHVVPLASINAVLARQIATASDLPFADWCERTTDSLRLALYGAPVPQLEIDEAIRCLATNTGGAVRLAAERIGLSERQFRRLFNARFGISPKQYQRHLRVDRMLRQLHPDPWEADQLKNCAPIPFADQSHAIREFRDLIGMTPMAYQRLKRLDGDHVLRSARIPEEMLQASAGDQVELPRFGPPPIKKRLDHEG
jgi:AraC-like DNA-binding protein